MPCSADTNTIENWLVFNYKNNVVFLPNLINN